MRYGILSDIHSNLEALETVLHELSREHIDSYLCLGDIVGYGADPNRCIHLIRELDPPLVIGNHDAGCTGRLSLGYFNEYARSALIWTMDRLDEQEAQYIKTPPYVIRSNEKHTLVHGTIDSPDIFNYMLTPEQAGASFHILETQILFLGHTHVPGIFEGRNEKVIYYYKPKIKLSERSRYIVNAGSVGQPRDGDPRASFVIYDTLKKTIEMKRVEYPIKHTAEKILKAGLSEFLANRLEQGV